MQARFASALALLLWSAPAAAGESVVVVEIGDGHKVVMTVDDEGNITGAKHRAPSPQAIALPSWYLDDLMARVEARIAACKDRCSEGDDECRKRCESTDYDPHRGREARSFTEIIGDRERELEERARAEAAAAPPPPPPEPYLVDIWVSKWLMTSVRDAALRPCVTGPTYGTSELELKTTAWDQPPTPVRGSGIAPEQQACITDVVHRERRSTTRNLPTPHVDTVRIAVSENPAYPVRAEVESAALPLAPFGFLDCLPIDLEAPVALDYLVTRDGVTLVEVDGEAADDAAACVTRLLEGAVAEVRLQKKDAHLVRVRAAPRSSR